MLFKLVHWRAFPSKSRFVSVLEVESPDTLIETFLKSQNTLHGYTAHGEEKYDLESFARDVKDHQTRLTIFLISVWM